MNNIYALNWWLPFPNSEYGGLLVISAEDTFELIGIMWDFMDENDREDLGLENCDDFNEWVKKNCSSVNRHDISGIYLLDEKDFIPIGKTDRLSGVITSFIT